MTFTNGPIGCISIELVVYDGRIANSALLPSDNQVSVTQCEDGRLIGDDDELATPSGPIPQDTATPRETDPTVTSGIDDATTVQISYSSSDFLTQSQFFGTTHTSDLGASDMVSSETGLTDSTLTDTIITGTTFTDTATIDTTITDTTIVDTTVSHGAITDTATTDVTVTDITSMDTSSLTTSTIGVDITTGDTTYITTTAASITTADMTTADTTTTADTITVDTTTADVPAGDTTTSAAATETSGPPTCEDVSNPVQVGDDIYDTSCNVYRFMVRSTQVETVSFLGCIQACSQNGSCIGVVYIDFLPVCYLTLEFEREDRFIEDGYYLAIREMA